MKGLLLLGLCFISLVVFSNGLSKNVSRPKVVKIGALFNFDSDTGRVAKIAIQEAVNDVNDNFTVLQGTKLDITFRNSNYSGFIGMIQALQFMQTDVVAIVGPQSSVVAHMISDVANELQVPLVSFAATDPTLSTLDFPYFVRTTHSDEYQMTAIADIIEYYGWKEVIAIYVDDEYGRNGVAALDDALADRRCRLIYKTGISPGSDVTRSELMDILVKVAMLESRVVVLHVNNDQGLMVFNVASYLGMMGNGYVWISNDWLSSSLDSSSLSPETMNTIQGVLTLRQHIPNLNMEKTFSSRWRNLTGGSLGLNSYGFYAYDSVWVLAHAIDAYLNQGGIISFSNISHILPQGASSLHLEAMHIFDGGEALLNNVLNSNLVGLTGPLKFNSERSLTRPAYDIINVIGTGYRQIGYWSNYSGLSTVIPETLYKKPPNSSSANQYLYPPVWPDGTTTPPRGWVFPNNGKQLKIGVPIRVSFKEFVSEVPGSNDFKGFCIDVFQAAVNLLSYPVPYQFVGFGDGHRNPNYTDLVNMIAAGNYDAVVGDVAIVTSRTRIVDFTQPYVASGLVLVAPFKKLNSGAWAFLRPFTPLTWGVIVVLFVVIGVIIWILEHRINDEFRGSPRSQFITILWFSFSTLTFSHRESPVSTLGRMVVLIWLFVVLILTSSYTASLTSILTVQQLSSPIKGIESLRSGDELIGYQTGSFAEQYLREELNISRTRLVAVDSPEDYAAAFRDGRIDALVDERPYVELFLSSRCDFRIVGQEFTRSGWGFAFPRDSPLALDFSTAILKLSENGDLQRIHDKWLTIGSCSSDNSEIESSQLHFRSFSGLFLICGLACVIALLIYFVRIFRRFLRTQTEVASDPQGSLRLSRLQTLLSLMDEKKDPSKRRKKRRKMEESSDDDVIDEESRKKFKRYETQSSRCGDSSPSN